MKVSRRESRIRRFASEAALVSVIVLASSTLVAVEPTYNYCLSGPGGSSCPGDIGPSLSGTHFIALPTQSSQLPMTCADFRDHIDCYREFGTAPPCTPSQQSVIHRFRSDAGTFYDQPCQCPGNCFSVVAGNGYKVQVPATSMFPLLGFDYPVENVLLGTDNGHPGKSLLRLPFTVVNEHGNASDIVDDIGGFVEQGGPVVSFSHYVTTTDVFDTFTFGGANDFAMDEPMRAYAVEMASDVAYTPDLANHHCTVGGGDECPFIDHLDCTPCLFDSDCPVGETCDHASSVDGSDVSHHFQTLHVHATHSCKYDNTIPCLVDADCGACNMGTGFCPDGVTPCATDSDCGCSSLDPALGGLCSDNVTPCVDDSDCTAGQHCILTPDLTKAADDLLHIHNLSVGHAITIDPSAPPPGTRDGHDDWLRLGQVSTGTPSEGTSIAFTESVSTTARAAAGEIELIACHGNIGTGTDLACSGSTPDTPFEFQPDWSRVSGQSIAALKLVGRTCCGIGCEGAGAFTKRVEYCTDRTCSNKEIRADTWPKFLAFSRLVWKASSSATPPLTVKLKLGANTDTMAATNCKDADRTVELWIVPLEGRCSATTTMACSADHAPSCPAGETCCPLGETCELACSTSTTTTCSQDGQCPNGQRCLGGTCKCFGTHQCPAGEFCIERQCRSWTPGGNQCTGSADCPGQICGKPVTVSLDEGAGIALSCPDKGKLLCSEDNVTECSSNANCTGPTNLCTCVKNSSRGITPDLVLLDAHLGGGVCGDGIVQPELGEDCDDSNREDGDGCPAACRSPVVGSPAGPAPDGCGGSSVLCDDDGTVDVQQSSQGESPRRP